MATALRAPHVQWATTWMVPYALNVPITAKYAQQNYNVHNVPQDSR